MGLMSFLAPNLKILLEHVPTLLFDVVPWPTLLRDGTQLSKRLLSGDGAQEARRKLAPHLPSRIALCERQALAPIRDGQLAGDLLLELYFRQVLSAGPFFLDLRATNLGQQDEKLLFSPGNLWGEFSAEFARGLRELYCGFYQQNDPRFFLGLELTGLIRPDWSEEDRAHMAELFRRHFGDALEGPMRFELQSFQASFQKIFEFLMHKKVHLTTDFLMLGVALVTLYLTLEDWGHEHAVSQIFHRYQLDAAKSD